MSRTPLGLLLAVWPLLLLGAVLGLFLVSLLLGKLTDASLFRDLNLLLLIGGFIAVCFATTGTPLSILVYAASGSLTRTKLVVLTLVIPPMLSWGYFWAIDQRPRSESAWYALPARAAYRCCEGLESAAKSIGSIASLLR